MHAVLFATVSGLERGRRLPPGCHDLATVHLAVSRIQPVFLLRGFTGDARQEATQEYKKPPLRSWCPSRRRRIRWRFSVPEQTASKTVSYTDMRTLAYVILVVAFTSLCQARRIVFQNNRGETVWVGSQGNAGKPAPNGGGWEMRPGSSVTIDVDETWAGRFWGRTGCNFDGSGRGFCQTGDCGGKLKCNGAGGVPPATLAEITLRGSGGNDFYDISLVDGFNLPVSMEPTDRRGGGDRFRCNPANCRVDINGRCPSELRVPGGCKSACLAFNTDQYCCRGAFGTAQSCRSSTWPVNYPAIFKGACPDAYSYAYDDAASLYSCADTGYRVIFS